MYLEKNVLNRLASEYRSHSQRPRQEVIEEIRRDFCARAAEAARKEGASIVSMEENSAVVKASQRLDEYYLPIAQILAHLPWATQDFTMITTSEFQDRRPGVIDPFIELY